MGRFFTDYERLEWVKKWKVSKLHMTEFARKNGLAYSTFRDWVYAYQNLEGSFVRIDPNIGNGHIGTKDDVIRHPPPYQNSTDTLIKSVFKCLGVN